MRNAKLKISYGLGAYGKDAGCAFVYIFLMYYLTDVIGVNVAFVGILFVVARLWDAIVDPLMGILVDNTSSRWGKFKPWIIAGTILNILVVLALFNTPTNVSEIWQFTYIIVFYLLWCMTYTMMDVPFWSMLPALSSDKQEREEIVPFPRIFASLAWLSLGSFGLYAVSHFGGGNEELGFSRLALVVSVFFMLSSLITVFFIKEKQLQTERQKVSFKDFCKYVTKNDQLLIIIVIVLVINIILQISGGMIIYYFKYVVGDTGYFGYYSAVSSGFEIVGIFIFPFVIKLCDRKAAFNISCLAIFLGFSLFYGVNLFATTNLLLICASVAIFKIGIGITLGLSLVMLADAVDYGEIILNQRNESIVFSFQPMVVKLAAAISAGCISFGLYLTGFKAETGTSTITHAQNSSTINFITFTVIILPIILSALIYIIYKKFYKLENKKFIENTKLEYGFDGK